MKGKIGFTVAALTLSGPALADFEAGGHIGYTMMSFENDGQSFLGTSFGFRAGYGVGLGLTPEVNMTLYSGSKSEGDETTSLTQHQTGVGTRFYLGNFAMRPFASGHLNYAAPTTQSLENSGSQTADSAIQGSGGMGFDLGAGLQVKVLDFIYSELFGTYARTFAEIPLSNFYIAAGAGIKI